MMRLFGLDALSLRALQKHYYHRYGTTLRGLMLEHQIDAEAFLSFVHDIDRSSLDVDHSLAAAIAALPGRKLILTNGSAVDLAEQARREGVRDLRQSGLVKVQQGVTTLEEVIAATND